MDKTYDNVISAALRDIHAYDSYFNKFNQFSLTFHFLPPKERNLRCSHDVMLPTKQTHTCTYYQFIQHPYTHNTPARQLHHRYQYINSKYTSPLFLNFTYCIKDTNLQDIIRNYDPISQMYMFCPLTKLFDVDESGPLIVPHEFIQHVEVPVLEFIYNTRPFQRRFFIFSIFTCPQILSTITQLAHEELFKIMNLSFNFHRKQL